MGAADGERHSSIAGRHRCPLCEYLALTITDHDGWGSLTCGHCSGEYGSTRLEYDDALTLEAAFGAWETYWLDRDANAERFGYGQFRERCLARGWARENPRARAWAERLGRDFVRQLPRSEELDIPVPGQARYVQFRMFNAWHVIRWEGMDEEHRTLCGRYQGWGVHQSHPPSDPDARVCSTCRHRLETPQEREARRLSERAWRARIVVDDEDEEQDEASDPSPALPLPSRELRTEVVGSGGAPSPLERATRFLLRDAHDRYRADLDTARARGDWPAVQSAAGKLAELDALGRDLGGGAPPP